MLRVLERDYEQSLEEMEKEFPNCKLFVRLNDVKDEVGFLQAVNDCADTHYELSEYIESTNITCMGLIGFYKEEIDKDVTYYK